MPMMPEERRQRILNYLAEHAFADVDTLVQVLQASPATVRRDLNDLADRGIISRTRGGAALVVHGVGHEPSYLARAKEHVSDKQAIAQLASTFAQEGEVIVLDVGTTTLEMAKAIRDRRSITVFTASLLIAQVLASSEISVVMVGGTLRKKEMSVAGPIPPQVISQFHFDRFFLGTAGVSVESGFTDFSIDDVEVKKAFLARSKEVIALADHTKLDQVSFASICPLGAVHRLITDSSADPARVEVLRQAGLEVILAACPGDSKDHLALGMN